MDNWSLGSPIRVNAFWNEKTTTTTINVRTEDTVDSAHDWGSAHVTHNRRLATDIEDVSRDDDDW